MHSVYDELTFEQRSTVLKRNMKKTNNPIRLILIALLCCLLQTGAAQVFPGDANNDGIVNNLDVLFVGYAYGSIGPARMERSGDFAEAPIPLFWEQRFANADSTNFAFADANGDGIVNFEDLLAVHRHYGARRLNPKPASFPTGMRGVDPQLKFGPAEGAAQATPGSVIEIPVSLESPMLDSVQHINGLAFSIGYDSDLIREIQLDYSDSWFVEDGQAFSYQIANPNDPNRYDGALTRFGRDPISGGGKVMKVRAIIEDDLIGLRPGDSIHVHLEIKFIQVKDGDFRDVPVLGDTTTIVIYHPDMLVPIDEEPVHTPIRIFPNPATDWLHIVSPVSITRIELYDATGRLIQLTKTGDAKTFQLNLSSCKAGIHFAKILSETGFVIKKIMIE